jgi:hypothetical protein
MSNQPFARYAPLIVLALSAALYLALALPQLRHPGMHHDEAQEAGLQAMQLLTGQPVTLFRSVGIAGRYPLMVQDYIGAFHVYWAIPFLAAGGVTIQMLRLSFVAIGLIILAVTYLAAREVWSARTGALAALLLSTWPVFVFWTRQGLLITSITLPVTLGALYAAVRWWRGLHSKERRGPGWLALAAFLLAFGLYAKLLTLWFAAAAVLMAAAVTAPAWWGWLRTRRLPFGWYEALAVLAASALGLAPLIAYNLMSGGTLLSITQNLGTSYFGVQNTDFFANLATRVRQVRNVLDGQVFQDTLGGSFANRLMTPAFLAAILLALAAALWLRRRATIWLLGVAILMVVESSFTVSALWHTHFGLHLPWFALLMAVALAGLPELAGPVGERPSSPQMERRGKSGVWLWIAAAAAALLAIANAYTTLRYHRELASTGGRLSYSSSIYTLAAALDTPGAPPVAAMDWGIGPAGTFLTAGRVAPQDIFGYDWEPDPGFAERVNGYLQLDEAIFVFHAPDRTLFQRRAAFDALLAAWPDRAAESTVITETDGAPLYEVIHVRRTAQ